MHFPNVHVQAWDLGVQTHPCAVPTSRETCIWPASLAEGRKASPTEPGEGWGRCGDKGLLRHCLRKRPPRSHTLPLRSAGSGGGGMGWDLSLLCSQEELFLHTHKGCGPHRAAPPGPLGLRMPQGHGPGEQNTHPPPSCQGEASLTGQQHTDLQQIEGCYIWGN